MEIYKDASIFSYFGAVLTDTNCKLRREPCKNQNVT